MIERRLIRNLDFPLMFAILTIMVIGVIIVGSATKAYDLYYVKRQWAWIALGWTLILLVLTTDYNGWARYASIIYWANVALLAVVMISGRAALGAQRWLGLPHPTKGPVFIQPSEFAKLAIIITLAYLLARQGKIKSWVDFVPAGIHAGIPMLLILLQPDLGTSLVFIAIVVGMLFMAGAPILKMATIFGGGFLAAATLIWVEITYLLPMGKEFPLKAYQLRRLVIFLDPEQDKLGDGYHIIQSKIAIGSGGIFGKGLFFGTQNQLNFLPEQHTDFIFSVIGEEMGFIGGAILLVLFFFVISRAVRVSGLAKDQFGMLIAAGVGSMLFFHVLVNIGMTIGVMPVTGIPLPFVSYGGSSMLTNSIAIGMLLNVYMRRHKIMF